MADADQYPSSADPSDFGKVAVVLGGWSAERAVSLMSGQQVLDALITAGVDAHAVDADKEIVRQLSTGRFDRAFLILHGRGGEDGTLQACLDLAGIPYTGTGVLGSALCMDKWRAKALVSTQQVSTPVAELALSVDQAVEAVERIGLPVVTKPVNEGSSLGVTMVHSRNQLAHAFEDARRFGPVLVEKFMSGMEVTAAVLGERVLPLVSMQPAGEFYDYHAKYEADDTQYQCPVDLPVDVVRDIEEMALRAFRALNCHGWARVDFMLDQQGDAQFIECNTAPGMTSHSLVPIAAQAAGIDFQSLCLSVLASSLDRSRGPA